MDVYFVDVEGGQATLIVSPSGKSLLVDTGWPGFEERDAKRIEAAAKRAGVKQIDYLMITHFHRDHVGGVTQLAARLPILNFVDHGGNIEKGKGAEELTAAYDKVKAGGKHLIVKPGDKIPVPGLDVQVITSGGEAIAQALKGAGEANPLCADEKPRDPDQGENARSVGILITLGKFRMIDLGDLTWNKELDLVCPSNRVGTVDVYLSTHHGMDMSGPRAIVHALKPRVAVMNNGARKGGTPVAWKVMKSSPGLEDLWQVHFAVAGGAEANVAEAMIANPPEACEGHYLRLSADPSGEFSVWNSRNKYQKTYKAR
jgi:beta-lactamase superfamily II metal-dependent hydrolase